MTFISTFSKEDNWVEMEHSGEDLWRLSSNLFQGGRYFLSLSEAAKEFDHLVTVIKYSSEM